MRFKLFLLFIVLPLIELALLIHIGQYIGVWYTIGILAVTGFLGAALAKQQGFSVFRRFNERLSSGDMPGSELLHGVIILVSGALLVTPGVLTDVAGFLGLIPLTRNLIAKYVMKRLKRSMAHGTVHMHFGAFGAGGVGHRDIEEPREEVPPGPGGWR